MKSALEVDKQNNRISFYWQQQKDIHFQLNRAYNRFCSEIRTFSTLKDLNSFKGTLTLLSLTFLFQRFQFLLCMFNRLNLTKTNNELEHEASDAWGIQTK